MGVALFPSGTSEKSEILPNGMSEVVTPKHTLSMKRTEPQTKTPVTRDWETAQTPAAPERQASLGWPRRAEGPQEHRQHHLTWQGVATWPQRQPGRQHNGGRWTRWAGKDRAVTEGPWIPKAASPQPHHSFCTFQVGTCHCSCALSRECRQPPGPPGPGSTWSK